LSFLYKVLGAAKVKRMIVSAHRSGFFAFALFLGLSPALHADSSQDEQIAARFAAADTNHDGQLTLAEAKAGMPRVAANFNKIDADHSGTVTKEEIKALADR
jgi:hypothetical protein